MLLSFSHFLDQISNIQSAFESHLSEREKKDLANHNLQHSSKKNVSELLFPQYCKNASDGKHCLRSVFRNSSEPSLWASGNPDYSHTACVQDHSAIPVSSANTMDISQILWSHSLFSNHMCSTCKKWQMLLLAANYMQVGVHLGNSGQKGNTLLGNGNFLWQNGREILKQSLREQRGQQYSRTILHFKTVEHLWASELYELFRVLH